MDQNALIRKGPPVLLLEHGSRDEEAVAELRTLAELLSARLDGRQVISCFLELAPPTVLDTIALLAAEGIKEVLAQPAFLLPAGHTKNDLPVALTLARDRYKMKIAYGVPLGLHSGLLNTLQARWAEALARLGTTAESTTLLVVGRGSSDPEANAEVYKLARLLKEGFNCRDVHIAYSGVTGPTVPEGVTRCAVLGAGPLVVIPFFLGTGVLVKRIAQQAMEVGTKFPRLQIAVAEHLGPHSGVVDAIVARLGELESGRATMTCDLCIYRAPLPGFEDKAGQPALSDHDHGLRTRFPAHDHNLRAEEELIASEPIDDITRLKRIANDQE